MNADRGMEDVRTLVLIQLVVINVLVKQDIHFTPTKNIAWVRICLNICFCKMASLYNPFLSSFRTITSALIDSHEKRQLRP